MKKLIKFPSIEQFRTVVANINRRYNFIGLDENGDAIYDYTLPKPTITFKGTTKLHGTNFGISRNNISGMWAQSRENIITPEKDNAGAAWFAQANKEVFQRMFEEISEKENVDLDTNTITIYSEWAGNGIQKGVAVNGIPKSMFIFGVKVSPFASVDENVDNGDINNKAPKAYWVDYSYLKAPESKIYNIDDFGTFEIDIDFNRPDLAQNKIIEMTMEVEKECPVGKAFGISGIGEGCVLSADVNGDVYRFKSKGERHAGKSKVKTLNKVDDEKINKTLELAEKVTPTWRLAQMLETSCNFMNGGTLDRSKLGEFIKLVIADIIKEDIDLLVEAGLEPKDIGKYVSDIARRYFFDQELI